MRILVSKLTLFSVLFLTLLTVSPAHANMAVVPLGMPARMDLTLLESLKPIAAGGIAPEVSIEEPAFESALSDKMQELRALRYMMRSA